MVNIVWERRAGDLCELLEVVVDRGIAESADVPRSAQKHLRVGVGHALGRDLARKNLHGNNGFDTRVHDGGFLIAVAEFLDEDRAGLDACDVSGRDRAPAVDEQDRIGRRGGGGDELSLGDGGDW